MASRDRSRVVANGLFALILSVAAPVSSVVGELTSPCTEKQHQCDAPAIARCCCIEADSGALPATSEAGPKLMSAPPMVAVTAASARDLSSVLSQDLWTRECTRVARPPLPLHLLNVSILR
jgi:hypothetical protein